MMKKDRYQVLDKVGSGNFSSVHSAVDRETGERVAVKVMRSHQSIALKQAALLKSFDHPNIVRLLDFEQSVESGQARMVLQFLPETTLELYQLQQFGLSEQQVKCILFQVGLGMAYIHERGIIHRDIKPENILINKHTAEIKLIDFGLAISERKTVTDYVATRWYRAPENLLGTKEYTTKIDVFSMACVAVELYLGAPLFPGADNVDQLYKIFNVLGQPTDQSWPAGAKKFRELGFKMDVHRGESVLGLGRLLKTGSSQFIDLIEKMLVLNPHDRISSRQMLQHPYFVGIRAIVPPAIYKRFLSDYGRRERSSSKCKEVMESAENFIKEARKNSMKREKSGSKEEKKQENIATTKESISLITPSVMPLGENNKSQIVKPVQSMKQQASGLSFRGFHPVKSPKIGVKQSLRILNEPQKVEVKQSRHNSTESGKKSLKNASTSIDVARKFKNQVVETRDKDVVGTKAVELRDFRTPEGKMRSIDKAQVQGHFRVEKLPVQAFKSPPLQKSLAFNGTTFKSHRFMTVNENSRLVRNLSEINPYPRRVNECKSGLFPQFPGFLKERERLSPGVSVNMLRSPRNFQRHQPMMNVGKQSIYTAPFHGKFQKMKIKPVPQLNVYQNRGNQPSFEGDSSLLDRSNSKIVGGAEMDRNRPVQFVRQSIPVNIQPQPLPRPSFPNRFPLELNSSKRMVSPEGKIKLAKSLEHAQFREQLNLISPLGGRRQPMQIPAFRPSMLVAESKDFREPRISMRKGVQNEQVVGNLSDILQGRRQDRNISINVNLSFVEDKDRGFSRRGRI